jgi:hypothetical protein
MASGLQIVHKAMVMLVTSRANVCARRWLCSEALCLYATDDIQAFVLCVFKKKHFIKSLHSMRNSNNTAARSSAAHLP